MVSKNNYQQLIEKCLNQRQHWGLRKLSIGVASVLLGTAIIAQGAVYADTQSAPVDSAENDISSTGGSAASGNTYVLKSSQDTSATTDSQTAATSAAPATTVAGEEQTDHDVNGVQTTFTRKQSALTGNSDSNPNTKESGEYWPDTKGASIKDYDKTTSTNFSTDKAASENQAIDPSTIKGYDQEYSDTPNLMHTQDLHLYVNGKEVDISTLQDDDKLNDNSEYPNHNSKGHAHLIKVSDFGPNTYFYARNAVQKYNQITGEIDHYDVKWTLESVNYANEQALLAFGIKGILDSGGNLLFNVGSGWQVAKRGNFANTHLQFFKEINVDKFANQDGALKETVAEAIKNGDIVATALKIHEGFLDLDSDEAIEVTESAVKHVLVDDSSTLAYQKTNDGYLAITRTYNDISNHDPKFGNSDSVAVLLELDVPEEGFDLSIVTTGPSAKGEISGGSKVAPAVLNTAAYLKTLTVNYYELDENGKPTTTKLKDTKTAHNFIGKSYGLQNTDQDKDGKQDAFDYSAPQTITDKDGTTWKFVKQTGNNLKDGENDTKHDNTYQDCLNVINYYYQKSEVRQQGTESVTYEFYNDQEKTKLVKEITKTPVYQDGKWQWLVKETDYDDQGNETHQATTTDGLMEGLSADQAMVKFTGTVNYDSNGKASGTTWDANNSTYGTIKTPDVEGYTEDKSSVGGETVSPNDSSLNREYKVVYTQNRYRLMEKFVDEDGHELLSSVPKGSSYKNGDGFDVTKDAKVIPGYVLIKQDNTSGKFGNGDQTATFIYKKVGKLIPMDPDGQPIPGADTPTYKNDPTDPTKVLNPTVPSIDDWQPKDKQPGDSITPKDPTQDTPVPYVQVVSGTIKYIDDTTGKELNSENLKKGTVGSKIDYQTTDKIKDYEDHGYELFSNNFSDGKQTYAKEGNNFEVHLKHATKSVTPDDPATPGQPINPKGDVKYPNGVAKKDLTATVKRTINYVDEDGNKVNGAPDGKSSYVQTAEFTRAAIVDKVTGKILGYDTNNDGKVDTESADRAWTPIEKTLDAVKSADPSSVGYDNVDIPNVLSQVVTPGEGDTTVTVTYSNNQVSGTIKYIDDTTGVELDSDNLPSGKIGSTISYTTADKIENYENQGYELVSNNFTDGTQTYAKEGNNFEVRLKHAIKESISYKDATQTIHYTGVGSDTPADKVQTEKNAFSKTDTVDKVTGKVTKTTGWVGTKTFGTEDTPVVKGYHADKKVAGGLTATPDNPDVEETVTYAPNGKLIPVDPNGKPIPGANTPTYTTDPKDPTKVLNPTVPSIDGWQPKDKQPGDSITPNDLGKDTPVPYVQVVSGTIKYVDDTTGKELNSENLAKGTVGSKISYTTKDKIKDYEDHGYELVSNDFKDGTQTYAKEGNDFEVHLKHATKSVTPDNPATPGQPINPKGDVPYPDGVAKDDLIDKVTRTINYVDAKGNPVKGGPNGEKTITQAVTFERTAIVDKVTGKILGYDTNNDGKVDTKSGDRAWTPLHEKFGEVESKTPAEVGFDHVDRAKVNAYGVNPGDSDIIEEVVYSNDPMVVAGTIQYIDDTTRVRLDEDVLPAGEVGNKINYTTKDKIKDYENQGYELVSNDFNDGSQVYAKEGNDFIVHLKHATKTITPEDPATPGDPINPNDPNSPVYPTEVDHKNLTKDATQTIHYIGAGDKTPADNIVPQKDAFTRTITIDKVTGKILSITPWSTKTFNTVNTPVVNGYHADKKIAGGLTATVDNPNVEETVTYAPNGKLIPVDENGTPIPGANTPTYTTDPKDPTKVLNPTLPRIDGWQPKDKQPGDSITPNDPGKDTLAPYVQVVSGTIKYIDDTTGKELSSENLAKGTVGSKISYTTKDKIKCYEDQGYELVSNNFTDGSQVYAKEGNDFIVHLKHKTQTITPNDSTPVTPGTPINPNDPNSPVYPTEVDHKNLTKDATQTIHYIDAGDKTPADKTQTKKDAFTRTITIDKVTGKVLSISGWQGSNTFGTEDTPVVNGYHADKKVAGGLTATPDNPDVEETVTYAPNGKLIPVDSNGKPIPGADTPTYTTDPKDPTKVLNPTLPRIDGWQPKDKQPGDSITPNDPGKDTPVIYVEKPQKPVMPVVPEQPENSAVPNNSEQPRTPDQPDNSKQPSKPTMPDQPNDSIVPNNAKHLAALTPRDQSQDIFAVPGDSKQQTMVNNSVIAKQSVTATDSEKETSLPQTGNDENQAEAAMGLGLTSLSTIMAMLGLKKRRHN